MSNVNNKFEPYQKVLVRANTSACWTASLYSHAYKCDNKIAHVMINCETFTYCIPFEGNEELLGTSKSNDSELDFAFGDDVMASNYGSDWVEGIFYERVASDKACGVDLYKVLVEDGGIRTFTQCIHGWLQK